MSSGVESYHCPDAAKLQELKDCANRMRISSIEITNASKSGHPTSASSAADIMSVLFFDAMQFDVKKPRDPNSDRFVLSKGHACPVLYAAWHEVGHLSKEAILTLRRVDSDIEGHPTPRLDFIDVATGSLGQGLSCAAGMAYVGKHWDDGAYRVYCLVGDGEMAEGSVWEAAGFASHYALDNLVGIFDINRLGQSEATMLGHDMATYQHRLEAFGWHVLPVDGHDVAALCKVFHEAKTVKGKPVAVLAKTFKGRSIPGVEDMDNWHGKPVGDKGLGELSASLHNKGPTKMCVQSPSKKAPTVDLKLGHIRLSEPPNYTKGQKVATRLAYGDALVKIGRNSNRVVALDGDTKNSTFSDKFRKQFPERFIECFIAEQNMVGVAVGCGTRSRTIPFCSTFAAFFTRAADQLRMGAISQANVKCVGSHVGVSIGEDGPSQMGLEDLALFRGLVGATVFYPSDAVACERAVELSANVNGICYIRTSRPATPVVYAADTVFQVGRGHVVRESAVDKLLIVGAGVTLAEALKAADLLAAEGVAVAVVDPFTIKPLDAALIRAQATRVGGKVLTVEDHYAAGGIGEAVSAALADDGGARVRSLAVDRLPRSGAPDELLQLYGISASCISAAARSWLAEVDQNGS